MRKTSKSFSFLKFMQQYFVDTPLVVGEEYVFTKEQAHHAHTVVRLDDEIVRLVYQSKGYFARAYMKEKTFVACVEKEDERYNEMQCDVTLAIALIRRERFEFVLQKATELGVKKIVPFVSSRCVVQPKKEKSEKQKARWETIVLEASQQCKRNVIPVVEDVIQFKDLQSVCSEGNYACYENAYRKASYLSTVATDKKSITVVIGPEGGFSEEEVEAMRKMNYEPITLGSRILRAETAALYACSVLSEMYEVHP